MAKIAKKEKNGKNAKNSKKSIFDKTNLGFDKHFIFVYNMRQDRRTN